MEPEAFVYCWHRNNGEFYYGVHKGSLDDGYIGSGTLFNRKFFGSSRDEWHRTIEFRGTYKDCLEQEKEIVTSDLIETLLCLNLQTGGHINNAYPSQATRDKMSKSRQGKRNGKYGKGFSYIITHPNGDREFVEGLGTFCRELGICSSALRKVALGLRTHHNNYKAEQVGGHRDE